MAADDRPSRLDPADVLELMRETSEIVAAAPSRVRGLERVVDRYRGVVADEVTAYVLDDEDELCLLTSEDEPPGPGPGPEHLAPRAIARNAVVVRSPEDGIPRIRNGGDDAHDGGVHEVTLPLRRDGRATAVLHLALAEGRVWSGRDVGYLEQLGRRLSEGLESVRLEGEARLASRAKADFLSVMNHELRTPLTAIVGYADILEEGIAGPVTEEQAEQLERIKEAADRLLKLIEGILGYARWEAGASELRLSTCDPRELALEAMAPIRDAFARGGVGLRMEAGEGLPELRTDREKVVRILDHLLSNARKFTDEGEVVVAVEADGDSVVFRVSDTGRGIDQADLGRIFEPFWQGDTGDTRASGGTGLGLSLARRLADRLSGRLLAGAADGGGSEFRLILPHPGPEPGSAGDGRSPPGPVSSRG